MNGFRVRNGDIVIESGDIEMVTGSELTRQTVESILNTNKGEWFLDIDEGINFDNILGKPKSDEIKRNEVLDGLTQVDETFRLDTFATETKDRNQTITFTAHNEDGETVEVTNTWD